MNGAQAVRTVLSQGLAGNARLHLLGEALELSPATTGLMAEAPERVHLLPAADASLVGVAVGLALAGQAVVVELADTAAVWGALQQLAQEAGALAHAPDFRPTLVVRVPWSPGRPDPSAVLQALPGVRLAAAGQPGDAAELLAAALAQGGVTVILEPAALQQAHGVELAEAPRPLGRAALLREGAHATALAWGPGVAAALAAAEALEGEGISLEVVDLRSLRPLDSDTLAGRVRGTGRPVLVGAPRALLAEVVDQAFLRLESPPAAVAADAPSDDVRDDVVAAVRASVRY